MKGKYDSTAAMGDPPIPSHLFVPIDKSSWRAGRYRESAEGAGGPTRGVGPSIAATSPDTARDLGALQLGTGER